MKPGTWPDPLAAFSTPRLLCRPLGHEDAPAFFAYRKLPQIASWHFFRPTSIDEVTRFLAGLAERLGIPGTWFQLAVCLKPDHSLICDVGIHFLDDALRAEIGYTIAPDWQGRGYAKEALHAVLEILFRRFEIRRVIASVDPGNSRSIALLGRLGFRREAPRRRSPRFEGAWHEDAAFVLPRREWIASGSHADPRRDPSY